MSVTRSLIADVYDSPILRVCDGPAPERARLNTELQQLYADAKFAEILARVDAYLPKDATCDFIAEQERSDVVHDLLAFLAERMLEMNKQKQQEIKGFLGWLEGEVGGQTWASSREDLPDRQTYRQSGLRALRADGRGDQDCGRDLILP